MTSAAAAHINRLRHDRIDKHGKLTFLVDDLDATTGDLLPELTIDPTRGYEPTDKDRYAR